MAGNEVGEVEEIGGNWDRDKVFVALVLKVDSHPNADRLSLPTLELGNGETATVAMVVSHANDSYFWVVTQFSSMDLKTGYRLQTVGTAIQGGVAAVTVWVVSLFVL